MNGAQIGTLVSTVVVPLAIWLVHQLTAHSGKRKGDQ